MDAHLFGHTFTWFFYISAHCYCINNKFSSSATCQPSKNLIYDTSGVRIERILVGLAFLVCSVFQSGIHLSISNRKLLLTSFSNRFSGLLIGFSGLLIGFLSLLIGFRPVFYLKFKF
jgi:hypothetical protein